MTGEAVAVPTTELQDAAWRFGLRAKDRSVLHITWRLTCAAPVDHAALRVAWQAVVDRHEALRLSTAQDGGVLTATVHPRVPAHVGSISIADPGSVPVDVLLRAVAGELHVGDFRLDRAPLARLTVVRVRDSWELVLTAHHLALDGWAVQVLLAELSAAYRAAARGAEPVFATEPPSWHEYARGQREARASGAWRAGVEHWARRLDGAVATTITADRDGYVAPGAPGETVRYAFGAAAVEGVAALAKATSSTPFAVVLAASQVLLARAGAGEDVLLGVVTANRTTAHEQRLAGYLANVCLIRGTVRERDTLADVVGRARGAVWEMFAHQAVPYPVVVSSLPEPTRAALGDTVPLMLNYLGPIGGGLDLGGIGLTLRQSPNQAARTDIAIAYWDEDNGGMTAEAEYSTVRYDRETVLRLLRDLDAVLAEGADGARAVGRIRVRSTASAPAGRLR
ncbi:MAG: condensation protein, partial [Streptomycetaceae bacterium]|nr:condensation protein [Streptomycetaceae bacterium]